LFRRNGPSPKSGLPKPLRNKKGEKRKSLPKPLFIFAVKEKE